jgi:small subunit ribosomal protein S8
LVVTLLPDRKLEFKRVSKCGQRIYTNADAIRKVKNGFGISIISTSQGLMTGYEAHAKKIGGEVLCEIA